MNILFAWAMPILLFFCIFITIFGSVFLYKRYGHAAYIAGGWWAFFTGVAVILVIVLFTIITSVIANNWRYPSVVDLSKMEQLSEEQVSQAESAIIELGYNNFISEVKVREYTSNQPTHIRNYQFGWTEKITNNRSTHARISVEVFRSEEYAVEQMQLERNRLGSSNDAFTYIANSNNTEAILEHPRTSVSASGLYIPSGMRLISWIRLGNVVIQFTESSSSYDLEYGENITSRYLSLLVNALIEEQSTVGEVQRVFLNLEYMYSIENIEVSMANNFEGEFTWYQPYDVRGSGLTFDELNIHTKREYGFELPEYIEFGSDSFIIISFGRKLQMYYYYPDTILTMYSPSGEVFAHPVFEREYHPNTVFVYRASPIPQYGFVDSLFTDEERQFNIYKNIPFEVWPHHSEFAQQELEKPLHGYVIAQETFLRSMPTRNSMVLQALTQGDYFTVFGYSDNGENVDGSSLWYYVLTPYDRGNYYGYVHSSFIGITSTPKE